MKVYSIVIEDNTMIITNIDDDGVKTQYAIDATRSQDVKDFSSNLASMSRDMTTDHVDIPHKCPQHGCQKQFDVPTSLNTFSRVFDCGCSTIPESPGALCMADHGCSSDPDERAFRRAQHRIAADRSARSITVRDRDL